MPPKGSKKDASGKWVKPGVATQPAKKTAKRKRGVGVIGETSSEGSVKSSEKKEKKEPEPKKQKTASPKKSGKGSKQEQKKLGKREAKGLAEDQNRRRSTLRVDSALVRASLLLNGDVRNLYTNKGEARGGDYDNDLDNVSIGGSSGSESVGSDEGRYRQCAIEDLEDLCRGKSEE